MFKARKKRVDFLICGAQKAGTTAIAAYLRAVEGVFLPDKKEIHFFDNHYDQGLAFYEGYFAGSDKRQLWGEVTPVYMYLSPCFERIHDYNPNMKIIMILRDPVDRAYSSWNMLRLKGNESRSFDEATRDERTSRDFDNIATSKKDSYLDRGLYTKQVRRAHDIFGKERVLTLKYEDFKSKQFQHMRKILKFIGAKPLPSRRNWKKLKKNSLPYDQPLSAEKRAELVTFFKDDITALETLLGWDCSDWRTLE